MDINPYYPQNSASSFASSPAQRHPYGVDNPYDTINKYNYPYPYADPFGTDPSGFWDTRSFHVMHANSADFPDECSGYEEGTSVEVSDGSEIDSAGDGNGFHLTSIDGDTSGVYCENGDGQAKAIPTIRYDKKPGYFIMVNDPPCIRLEGNYRRYDFNKSVWMGCPAEDTIKCADPDTYNRPSQFSQEEINMGINSPATAMTVPLPEKGMFADKSLGQRSLFTASLQGDIQIAFDQKNCTNSVLSPSGDGTFTDVAGINFHFAVLLKNVGNSAVTVDVLDSGASIGLFSNPSMGQQNSSFIDYLDKKNSTFNLTIAANGEQWLHLARQDGNLTDPGPCVFSTDRSQAVSIEPGIGYFGAIRMYTNRPLYIYVLIYKNWNDLDTNTSASNISDRFIYWGTYKFSRYITGFSSSIENYGVFSWTIDDTTADARKNEITGRTQGALTLLSDIGHKNLSWWATNSPYNSEEDVKTDILSMTVQRADYTKYGIPKWSDANKWEPIDPPEAIIPSEGKPDPRTPMIEYSNNGNWGVVYREKITVVNDGTQPRLIKYYLIAPFDQTKYYIAVKVGADTAKNYIFDSGNIIQYPMSQLIFIMEIPPGQSRSQELSYMLISGSAPKLLHRILLMHPSGYSCT
ncbi:MAG: hypothetical protein LBS72_09195 [Oscillospiraceae bacterium]|jgi:hypothetical protein|nr:hypothetical protein [Oscillospiraceae bacterium]